MFLRINKDKNIENQLLIQSQQNKVQTSQTGLYCVENGLLIPMDSLPGNGSINVINAMFGYSLDLVSTVISSQLILVEFIVVDKSTLRPLFFGMRDKDFAPSYRDIEMDMQRLDWNFQSLFF